MRANTGKAEVLMLPLLQSSPVRSPRPLCWTQGQGGEGSVVGEGQLRELEGA